MIEHVYTYISATWHVIAQVQYEENQGSYTSARDTAYDYKMPWPLAKYNAAIRATATSAQFIFLIK